ncbi:MAG: sigma-70 family RNA polymerase sigma factor [Sandaracinaceae bacterium]|nr:sigma-70 family RNA polymerase sigma factor [Sandaracinaceae bacterium]
MDASLRKSSPSKGLAVDRDQGHASASVGAVFDRHAAYVGRALRCLGVPEREVPDALQEVFLVVHRRLGELRTDKALRAWLYAICVRKALTFRRRAARSREHGMDEPPEASAPTPSPDEELARTRSLALALEILEDLDDDKRAVFVLYEVEQLPMSEVKDALDVPLQTAYSRLYAARRQIERKLRALRARGRAE